MKLKKIVKVFLFIGIIYIYFSCDKSPDAKELEKEILALHQEMIDAHIHKKVDFFTKDLADDYLHVQRGEINHPSQKEIKERFEEYLNHTTFTTYENLQDPIVKISNDGSLAWCIVQMKIEGERKIENDSIRNLNFVCAWISLYERIGDKWINLGIVDNFKMGE